MFAQTKENAKEQYSPRKEEETEIERSSKRQSI